MIFSLALLSRVFTRQCDTTSIPAGTFAGRARTYDSRAPERRYRGGRSYVIPVWNGIFEHCHRIGEGIWEFLWCLDAVTQEKEGIGMVHGGAPVKIERIAADLSDRDQETVRRHLKKLQSTKYIRTRRTPYGQVIEVLNSKKFGIWKCGEKPQKTGSLPGEIHTGEGEIHTGEGEKPQFAVSKEDSAVTQQEDSAVRSARVLTPSQDTSRPADASGNRAQISPLSGKQKSKPRPDDPCALCGRPPAWHSRKPDLRRIDEPRDDAHAFAEE